VNEAGSNPTTTTPNNPTHKHKPKKFGFVCLVGVALVCG